MLKRENVYNQVLFLLSLVASFSFIHGYNRNNVDENLTYSFTVEKRSVNVCERGNVLYPNQLENYLVITEESTLEDCDANSVSVLINSDNSRDGTGYIWALLSVKYHKFNFWNDSHSEKKVEQKQWLRLNKSNSSSLILNTFVTFTKNSNSNLKSHPPPPSII